MSASLLNRITINPEIAHGKPTIRNKRYTVEGLLEYLAGGDSTEDLLKEFPDLEKEDIQACLQYAVLNMKHKYAEIKSSMKFLLDAQLPPHSYEQRIKT